MVVWLVTVKTRAAVPPPVIVPVIAPVDAPLQVIVAVCETFVKVSEAVFVKFIAFDASVFEQASVTVTMYWLPVPEPPVRFVGASAGIALNATPPFVQEYVYGLAPPATVTVADPVAVEPQGCSSTARTTLVIDPVLMLTFTAAVSLHPAAVVPTI